MASNADRTPFGGDQLLCALELIPHMSPSSNPVDDITTEQGAADKRVESLLHQRYRGELPVPIASPA